MKWSGNFSKGVERMDIDLDQHFRRDSGARSVAERLLTGRPATRQQLVGDRVGITTVNRVVAVLEQAGATIERSLDGRQIVYRVGTFSGPKKPYPFPQLDERGRLVKQELIGNERVVEFEVDSGMRFRGVLDHKITALPPVGTEILVAGIARDQNRDCGTITLETQLGERIQLEAAQGVAK
jgi:hypothetical protein